MPRSRGRRPKQIPPAHKRRSWFARLSPEARVIGLVVVLAAAIGVIVAWPRAEQAPPQKLVVAVPADEAMRLALVTAQRSFTQAHKDIDVIFVEAGADKLRAYEAMWRKGKSGVDLLIGAEDELTRWGKAGLLEPWDEFLAAKDIRLAHVGLEAGQVAGEQAMLPVALELTCIKVSEPGDTAPPLSLEGLARDAQNMRAPGGPALGADWEGPWAAAVILSTARAGGAEQTRAMPLAGAAEALAWWRGGVSAGWVRKPSADGDGGAPPLLWAGQGGWLATEKGSASRVWLPPRAAERGTVCVVYGALLPRHSEHKEAARLFVADLVLSQGFQYALAQRTGLLPAAVGTWGRLKGPTWEALAHAATDSIPLSPELRSPAVAERFAQVTRSCLAGEIAPAAAAAELARAPEAAERPAGKRDQGPIKSH